MLVLLVIGGCGSGIGGSEARMWSVKRWNEQGLALPGGGDGGCWTGYRTAELLLRCVTPPFRRPEGFDSEWERRLDAAMRSSIRFPNIRSGRSIGFRIVRQEGRCEVDGRAFHTDLMATKISDLLRDKELMARGWKVRRLRVSELHYDMELCLDPCLSG